MFKVTKRDCPMFGIGPYVCEFICDTASDIATLPTSISEGTGGKTVYDNQKCASGSIANVAENGAESKQYILNNQDIWCPYSVAVGSSSGGSSESSITVDFALSGTSENPVANKVITAALNEKADASDIPDLSPYAKMTDVPKIKVNEAVNANTVDGMHASEFMPINGEVRKYGPIRMNATDGIRARHIDGNDTEFNGALYLNFNSPNAPIYMNGENTAIHSGNIGSQTAYTISEWGAGRVCSDVNNAELGFTVTAGDAGHLNAPNTFWSTVLTTGQTEIYQSQIAFPWSGDHKTQKIKYRSKDNGTWFEWENIADGGNADTLDGHHEDYFAKSISPSIEGAIRLLRAGNATSDGSIFAWEDTVRIRNEDPNSENTTYIDLLVTPLGVFTEGYNNGNYIARQQIYGGRPYITGRFSGTSLTTDSFDFQPSYAICNDNGTIKHGGTVSLPTQSSITYKVLFENLSDTMHQYIIFK